MLGQSDVEKHKNQAHSPRVIELHLSEGIGE